MEYISDKILKLEYRRSYFDIAEMKPGARTVITIFEDGTIVSKDFKPGSRKAQAVLKKSFPVAAYNELCKALLDCIKNADRQDFYVDDSSEELRIYHQFGRIQTMDRGVGNEYVHITDIMHGFFEKYL